MDKLFSTILLLSLLLISIFILGTNCHEFSRRLSKKTMGLKRQKLSHLHFYFHDQVSGKNPTAIKICNTSVTGFGLLAMIDDTLTIGPEPNSKLVGRAQGVYAQSSLNDDSLLMVFNFAFVQGKYNGSSLSVLGRNSVMLPLREMPVIGGSGVFRFAYGYAQAKTYSYNVKTGDAVSEYDVYVFHY
ncbi:hypothetical protein CQW23_26942 [Capsicum baccatum]|uniref:Dirigent protein n=1 Tax=Capsicum baccatum TaxID=33114 RepID=A0A2G2VQA2_CAPBA|nr:hypothetical protein CQW23_26942 [Capsicum baccatum]